MKNDDLLESAFVNTLVVIPARGGSKRIPKKNIKILAKKPMIQWPLESLIKIFTTEQILVSTDDSRISKLAKSMGLSVPFQRPKNLSDDHTGTVEVVKHALDWYESHVKRVDFVLIVYPTAVMLETMDILNSYEMISDDPNCNSVCSVCSFPAPIERAINKNTSGYIEMNQPKHYNSRSQDLKTSYYDAGQFYLCRSKVIAEEKPLVHQDTKAVVLPRIRSVDIDTIEDLEMAEAALKYIKNL